MEAHQGPPVPPPTGEFEDSASGLALPRGYSDRQAGPGPAAAVAEPTSTLPPEATLEPQLSLEDIDFSDAPEETLLTSLPDAALPHDGGFQHPVLARTLSEKKKATTIEELEKINALDERDKTIDKPLDYTLVRFGQPGDVMAWSENDYAEWEDRAIIMHGQSDKGTDLVWFIKGDKVFTIKRGRTDKGLGEPELSLTTLSDGARLPELAIGQELSVGEVNPATGEDVKYTLRSVQAEDEADSPLPLARDRNYDSADPHPEEDVVKPNSDPFKRMEELVVFLSSKQRGALAPQDEARARLDPAAVKQFQDMFGWEKEYAPKEPKKGLDYYLTRRSEDEIAKDPRGKTIFEYAEDLQDATYVPTPTEFKELQHIKELLTSDEEDNTGTATMLIPRIPQTGERVDTAILDTVLDGATEERWELTDFQIDTYQKALLVGPLHLKLNPLFTTNQLGGILTMSQFIETRQEQLREETTRRQRSGEKYIQLGDEVQIADEYDLYVSERLALARDINKDKEARKHLIPQELAKAAARRKANRLEAEAKARPLDTGQAEGTPYDWEKEPDLADEWAAHTPSGPEEELEVPAFVTANDVAFRALADYRRWQAENTISKQAGRALDRGLTRVHKANMRVDAAVRKKMDGTVQAADRGLDRLHRGSMRADSAIQEKAMDPIAARAARVKAKAEEFKENWDGDLDKLLGQAPKDTNQAAVRKYIAWQREQAEKNGPKAMAKKAVRKTAIAAAKLRRRNR